MGIWPGTAERMGGTTWANLTHGLADSRADFEEPYRRAGRAAAAPRSIRRRRGDARRGRIAVRARRDLRDKCEEWAAFFVEAVTDYIVHQEKPSGYISAENADWLIRAVSRDGMVGSRPSSNCWSMYWKRRNRRRAALSSMRCDRSAHAVVEGKGPLMLGGELVPGADRQGGGRACCAASSMPSAATAISPSPARRPRCCSRSTSDGQGQQRSLVERTVRQGDRQFRHVLRRLRGADARCGTSSRPSSNGPAEIGGFFGRMVSGGVRGSCSPLTACRRHRADWEPATSGMKQAAPRRKNRQCGSQMAGRAHRPRWSTAGQRASPRQVHQASLARIHPDLKPLLDKVA